MTEVTQGVYFIQGQDEMIPDSHVYLIGKLSSEDLTLVDAGLVGRGAYKLQTLKEGGVKLASIKRVIMTHTHLDHIGCLSEIMKELPSAELWIHTLEAEPIELGDDRGVYGMQMFKQMCQTQYRLKDGAFKFKVDRKLQGGESLDIGGMSWEVLHIPGHSMGGIALYHKDQGVLIPGDVIYADYAIGRFDLHGANPSQLKDSLMKLAAVEVNVLLPGHNRIVKDVAKGYILQTAKQWASYLE
jgi:hydroxyacylglutathione hydrolase